MHSKRSFSQVLPYKFAYGEANFVPIAISSFWWYLCVPISKKIFVKIIRVRLQRELAEIDWSYIKLKYSFTVSISLSFDIWGFDTENVTKCAPVGVYNASIHDA